MRIWGVQLVLAVVASLVLLPPAPAWAEGNVQVIDIELTDEQVLMTTGFQVDHLLAEAEAGVPRAQYLVAWAWIAGKKGAAWEPRAKEFLLKAADAGEPRAMAFIASLMSNGRVFTRDEKEALRYALRAAEAGSEAGQWLVALAYENGAGVNRDRIEALKWYLLCACQGIDVHVAVKNLRAALTKSQQEEAHRRVFDWKAAHPTARPLVIGRSLKQLVSESRRETHQFELRPGEPGQVFATKVGGAPWWPQGVPRPACSSGHRMKFVSQILLSDVPGLRKTDETLLSFHYCNECQKPEDVYDVRLFSRAGSKPDGKGVVTAPFGNGGTPIFQAWPDYMSGFDQFEDGSQGGVDITSYANLDDGQEWLDDFPNATGYKLGGWPSWLQGAFSPECPDKQKMVFAGQIDSSFSSAVIWGGGGYAYLFVCPDSCKKRHVEVFIQFT